MVELKVALLLSCEIAFALALGMGRFWGERKCSPWRARMTNSSRLYHLVLPMALCISLVCLSLPDRREIPWAQNSIKAYFCQNMIVSSSDLYKIRTYRCCFIMTTPKMWGSDLRAPKKLWGQVITLLGSLFPHLGIVLDWMKSMDISNFNIPFGSRLFWEWLLHTKQGIETIIQAMQVWKSFTPRLPSVVSLEHGLTLIWFLQDSKVPLVLG